MGIILFLLFFIYTAYIVSLRWKLHSTAGAILGGAFLYSWLGGSLLIALLAVIGVVTSVYIAFNTAFRLKYLTEFFYEFLKKQLPPISETERIALEAGDSSVEADVFRAEADFNKQFPLTNEGLTEEELDFINNKLNHFCSKLDDWEINEKLHDLPKHAWEIIKKEKLMGLVIPKEYGGLGFSALAHSTIVNKIASMSGTAAVSVMVPNSLGPGELIYHYGTEEQKKHYLPRLAKGEEIPCFALTSTTAGSDATSIQDTGIVCKRQFKGKQVVGISLTFEKRYITLAPIATLIGLAFRLFDPDHLLGESADLGITLALLPRELNGLEIGKRHYPMHLSFMNGPVVGKDVFIPLEYIIGGEKQIGEGWKMLMECLGMGRGISIPALGNASTKFCYLCTSNYSAIREQFGRPIADFEGIQMEIGKLGGLAYLSEAQRRMNLYLVDQGLKPSLMSAISKLHLSEFGREAINSAFDVFGGKAIQMGPKNFLAWGYFAVPVMITVEGANILTRNLIVFGQGLIRSHPYVKQLVDLAYEEDNLQTQAAFDKALWAYTGYVTKNFATVMMNHLTFGWQEASKYPKEVQQACRRHQVLGSKLALLSDLCLMILGGKLKFKESISARLGDALSFLTMHYSLVQYYRSNMSKEDGVYFQWASQFCLHKAEDALYQVIENLPSVWHRLGLKLILFPIGRQTKGPTDAMSTAVAKLSQRPHDFRDRVLQEAFMDRDSLRELEECFLLKIEIKEHLKILKKAVKVGQIDEMMNLSEQNKSAFDQGLYDENAKSKIERYSQLLNSIVSVDEFDVLNEASLQEIA